MTNKASAAQQSIYPVRGGGWLGILRSGIAMALLGFQLVIVMFLFEIPMHLADRFMARKRGDAFNSVLRGIARWFFRLYPVGRIRRINVKRSAFTSPCVIVCNHQSRLDLLAALTLPVKARWLTPKWMFKLPLMGELFKLGKHPEISDRTRNGTSAQAGLEDARALIAGGTSVLGFPEGHRSRRGNLGQFRNAVFQLAIETKSPLVPVIIDGTGASLQKGDLGIRSPCITLRVLESIRTEGFEGEDGIERLKQIVHKKMASALDEVRQSRSLMAVPNGLISRAAIGLVVFSLISVAAAAAYVQAACIAQPPTYSGSRALKQKQFGTFEEAKTLGENWTRIRGGIMEIALTGPAWERGYASAKFTPEQLKAQEDHLLKTADEFLPWPKGPVRWLLKQGIGLNNRNLPDFVSENEKLEILGLVEGSIDHHPGEVPLYHRVLNYHAAHDISHMLIDNPLIVKKDLIGCTGFAVWGPATLKRDDGTSNLLLARNFDWEAGQVFDQNKVIYYVWPDTGIPYVHVAWSGMAGAVTGMNAKGLAVSLNAAHTDDSGKLGSIGTPVSLLVKRVLNEAATIDEAVKIIRETPVFVSDSYMVASRSENRAVVVEKSPNVCAVREAARPGLLLQANHFMHKDFESDTANSEQMQRATTLYRYGRLQELADENYGKFQTGTCLGILRDRKGKGGKDVGMGNRNTLDAFICTHSVIMDVSLGVMWVSSGPNTVGSYVRVDVSRMLDARPQGALRHVYDANDDFQKDNEYYYKILDYNEFKKQLKFAREAIDEEDLEKARPAIKSLFNLNPRAFETAYFEGRLAWLEKKYPDAKKSFEEALARDPHYEEVREEIRGWLQKASDK